MTTNPQEKNYEKIVLNYLKQKGYFKSEAVFREETLGRHSAEELATKGDYIAPSNVVQAHNPAESTPNAYSDSFASFSQWVHSSLDLYQQELVVILYPVFVHCYLDLIQKGYLDQAKAFMDRFKNDYQVLHSDELIELEGITTPETLRDSEVAKLFRTNRFYVKLSQFSYELMKEYIHEKKFMLILNIINQYLIIRVFGGKPPEESRDEYNAITGISETNMSALNKKDIHWELYAENVPRSREPTAPQPVPQPPGVTPSGEEGKAEVTVKKEEKKVDLPKTSGQSPIPLKRMSEQMELQYLDDLSKRVALSATSLPSICFYTMFHTHDSLNTIAISQDSSLIAGGFANSSAKLWNIMSRAPAEGSQKRKRDDYTNLVGHTGPVFGASFSPDNDFLLTSSQDSTVRLWNVETRTNVVCYKSHNYPVWDVDFSPLGFYFASASHDRTARLWVTDAIFPVRIFAGHLSDVNCVKFHPNCNYVATGSSDKTLRLWDIQSGSTVRIFTGHYSSITAVAVSPDGKQLASAAEDNKIMLWDLASSRKMATFNGHRGTIWSLDFSADGTLLASGSADQTVRCWDVTGKKKMDVEGQEEEKDKNTSPELLKTFVTKQTPVFRVRFTRRNLLLAGGPFQPHDSHDE